MRSKMMKSIKEHLTPHIVRDVQKQGVLLTILWVSSVLVGFGFLLALLLMYSRIMVLEQAIAVLASR